MCLWPLAFGLNAEKTGLGNGVLWLIAHNLDCFTCCCSSTLVRMNIREQHDIPGTCCGGKIRDSTSGIFRNEKTVPLQEI